MTKFKSFIGMPGGSETQKCFYPFKLDTYGRGCVNNCVYCYAKATLGWRKMWDAVDPAQIDFGDIEQIFRDSFSNKKKGKISELIRNKVPVRLGSMTDCFSEAERTHGITLRLLRLLKDYEYPYLILTKCALVAEDEYIDALDPKLAYIQFTTTTPYDEAAAKWEPGASVTSERLSAMKKLSDNGFIVAGRICPIIPNYPDGYYSAGLYQDAERLDVFDWSLIDLLAEHGCRTVIAGFMRLNYYNHNRKQMMDTLGFDLGYLFPKHLRVHNKALYFSAEEKRYYYERLRQLTYDNNMRFSVCYDGDDYYEMFHYLWDNPEDCCDAPFRSLVEEKYLPIRTVT